MSCAHLILNIVHQLHQVILQRVACSPQQIGLPQLLIQEAALLLRVFTIKVRRVHEESLVASSHRLESQWVDLAEPIAQVLCILIPNDESPPLNLILSRLKVALIVENVEDQLTVAEFTIDLLLAFLYVFLVLFLLGLNKLGECCTVENARVVL